MVELVLLIPQADGEGNQRENITRATDFDEALDLIYTTIGCADVGKKPKLSYKLATATAKEAVISLASVTDWEGLVAEVTAAEKKKKSSVAANILVTEQYMLSLRAQLNIKKAPTGNKRGKKIQILDLEHAGSGDDDFDEGLGIMEKESKFVEQLQSHHGRCQLCGPSKACKIDVSGNHQVLSNNMLKGWARALAAETHGVTMVTPPRAGLFSMFFKSMAGPAGNPPATPGSMAPGYSPFMNPYVFMPWGMKGGMGGMPGMMGGNPFNSTMSGQLSNAVTPSPLPRGNHLASSSALSGIPSSDPPEMGALNPYPEIADFFRKVDVHYPRRCLLDLISNFDDQSYFNIEEIATLGSADTISRAVSITTGNAAFILGEVLSEIKRIDKAKARSRA
ncbi:hypothetical protein DFH07DRAFT_747736 [Mycena maculata]|uniref:Uncharacterized protein n=1 Tax=Mycena maculata TaxID=230809 RepID=A0AAD7IPC4_9AGAR|nr:hypothetical protein DFH07DRAFT_747736 [Mycena maculata]